MAGTRSSGRKQNLAVASEVKMFPLRTGGQLVERPAICQHSFYDRHHTVSAALPSCMLDVLVVCPSAWQKTEQRVSGSARLWPCYWQLLLSALLNKHSITAPEGLFRGTCLCGCKYHSCPLVFRKWILPLFVFSWGWHGSFLLVQ